MLVIKMSEVSKKARNLGGLQQCFSNWQFQDSVLLKELGHGFCHWTTAVVARILKQDAFCIILVICTSYSKLEHTIPIPNVTATLKPTLALTTLESGSEMRWYGAGTSKKSAKQICPNFGQTWACRSHHLDHPPNQNSYHPNARLFDDWRHYFNRSYQIVVSVQLEPKVAILKCYDFRLHPWKKILESCHDFRKPNLSSWRFRVTLSFSSETYIRCRQVFPITPSFQRSEQLGSRRPRKWET